MNNFRLLAYIILGFLLITAVSTVLPKLTHANGSSRLKSLKLILFRAPFMDHNQMPRIHLRLVLLRFNLFLFFNLNFLSSTIKTEKVAVPTFEIVDSDSKLVSSSKTLIIYWKELDLIRKAPKGSFLSKLSSKKILEVRYIEDLVEMKAKGVKNYVTFAASDGLFHLLNLPSRYANEIGAVEFTKATVYYERLSTVPMRRNLDEKRKRFINSRWLFLV